ncbi:mitogen-activated protein kinase-binding protein 1, partial [Aplysia californica]|uniref:Mitogen-activated protein kinase-binding protein 1 n=1 Tax=Aplysia californica TaxID=6500 RepID=A0ABM1A9U4_APLCA
MNLDLALGISCVNLSSLAFGCVSGLLAYPASGVLVVYSPKLNCQVAYLHVRRNSVSCANFSPDGRYVLTGEVGYKPALRVWRLQDGQEVATIYGHEFGIKSAMFSPRGDVIVSVGLENDNEVNVWAWPDKHRVATNKIKDLIYSVSFSQCGQYFLTAGVRHLKFWYPKLPPVT